MKIELTQKKSWKKLTGITLFVFAIAYAAFAVSGKSTKSLTRSTLSFQTVESGPMDIYTSAYGEFTSAKERLLTAPALGKVAEIFVRPGAKVTAETVILHLANPQLEQQVSQAEGILAQQKASREAFKYEQQNERLNYQGRIADIEAEIEKEQLELSALESLMNLGVSSKIEVRRAKLAVKQETKRLGFEQKRYQQFIEMQGYQLTQQDITVTQRASEVTLLRNQLDDMHVKAGINGTLQTLETELGQSVQLGESLAKVGSDNELIARIRLPQNQADQIDIDAPVIIDTQKGRISAHIIRIESVVTNGSVLAEVALDGELTSNARPSLAISAQVFIKHDVNSIFINQTPGFRPRSKQSLFVKDGNDMIVQRDVTFGELSQQKLMVTAGLSAGDEIVSSDISQYEKFSRISITN